LRGIGAGGKGVYSFLVGLVFLRCAFFFLNDGRKRSHDSSLSAGSFSSSRLGDAGEPDVCVAFGVGLGSWLGLGLGWRWG
jgi:hypothetical protein